jgi:hypothetical protein
LRTITETEIIRCNKGRCGDEPKGPLREKRW